MATKEITTTNTQYEISNVDSTLTLANDLANFIKEKKLCSNIKGKDFVNVEGWSYAGVRLGLLPIVKKPVRIESEGEVKYECEVELLNINNDRIFGYGYAICSNKEQSKKYFDEYAIASMAQTRAIGKAYRNTLAWVIKAAGYEPTPAEEMEDVHQSETGQQPTSGAIKKDGMENRAETYITETAPKPATAKQKEDIRNLLNNKLITADEESKMLQSINSLTEERAKQAIAKLKKTIEEREQGEHEHCLAQESANNFGR